MSNLAHKQHRLANQAKANEKLIEVKNIDYTILITVVLLVLIGIVMVFSSSYYVASTSKKYNYDMYYLVKSQARAAIVGFAAMIFMSGFNYRYLKRFSMAIYFVAIGLLIATALFGVKVNDAKRWIYIPGLGQFQPSETAKIAIILVVARIISAKKDILKSLPGTCIPAIFIVICAGIIGVGTNNMSSAIIVAIIGFGMIFIASPYTAIFLALGSGAVGGLVLLLKTSDSFRGDRFDAWLDPFSDPMGKGFQIIQSLFAVASGGMFGLGLGQSRQKLGFIPEAHNDIIFSIICEEMGLVGAGLVLFLFGVLVWRAIYVAINAPDLFGSLIATGIALMIGSQVVINVAVVTNTIPNTGVPLPFISFGGTSLAIMMFCMGVLLNISRYVKS